MRLDDLLQADGGPDGTLAEARRLSADLRQALPNRFVIERAKGVVMGCLGCDLDTAFQELRQESQRTNRPLRDLAEEVATTGRLPWRTAGR
jgi:AmiR/NasT family two-component response regulator